MDQGRALTPALVCRCLIVAPADVDDARSAIEEAIGRWNAEAGPARGARVEPVRWDPLTRATTEDCELGVALLWSSLGAPTRTQTSRFESGAMEEVHRRLVRGRPVTIYACDAPIPPGASDPHQRSRLAEVEKTFLADGLWFPYTTTDDLTALFTLHLTGWVDEMLDRERVLGHRGG